MSNFTSANPSYDKMLADCAAYGIMNRSFNMFTAPTTQSNTTGVAAARYAAPLIIPTVGTGVQGYCLVGGEIMSGAPCSQYIMLEYLLGELTLNGNTGSNFGSMPTKTQLGTSAQTASKWLLLVVTTAGTATTPTITVTYTNQDGTPSQSTTFTLPTTPAVNSAYLVELANGDSGVQAVSALSSSVTTGTMVLSCYGVLELGSANLSVAGVHGTLEPLITPTYSKFLCAAGEAVNHYSTGTGSAFDVYSNLVFAPETT